MRSRVAALLAALLLAALGPAAAAAPPETAAACAGGAAAGPATGPRLLVTGTGAQRVAGNITFTLYGDDPARFLKPRGSLAIVRVTLAGSAATACFAVSRPGIYAVAIYHDENNNHHFDRSALGLPAEGYGFSRDAMGFLAPPSFRQASFAAGTGVTRLAIRLRY